MVGREYKLADNLLNSRKFSMAQDGYVNILFIFRDE